MVSSNLTCLPDFRSFSSSSSFFGVSLCFAQN